MPTPTNAPSTTTGGKERQLPELFARLTERQEMPQVSAKIPGFASEQKLTIEKVGVVSRIRLLVEATFETKAAEEPTLPAGFPWKLIKKISIEANGVTGIISCSGPALEQRRRRVYRNPVKAIKPVKVGGEKLAAATKYTVQFAVEIPIAHDMLSLIGSLLAQNEETQLSVDIVWCSEAEVAAAAKFVKGLEGTVKWSSTVFSIGSTTIGKEQVTVLPDLSAFHGLIEKSVPAVAKGEQKTELTRNAGQLLCYVATLLNKPGAVESVSPETWTTFFLEYGGNKKPRVFNPLELWEQNADDYDGPVTVEGQHNLIVDNEIDNPTRDMIFPMSLTELRAVVGIAAATVLEEAQIVTSQETLYPAV